MMRVFNHRFSRMSFANARSFLGVAWQELRSPQKGQALAQTIRVIRVSIMVMVAAASLCLQAAEPTITVKATPRYPWSGMVDVAFTITGDSGLKYDTSFKVLDVEGNEALPMKTVYKSDGSRASATESLLPGTYRWSWDAKADVEEDMIKSSGCLSTTATVVFENRQLSSVTEFSAIPCGKAISDKTQRVKGIWIKADGNGKEVQFVAADGKYTKCVCVHFEQQGSDIVANIKWAKYVDGTGSTAKDFNAITATTQTIATSEATAGYGLRSVAIKTSDYKAPFCCERVKVVGDAKVPGYPVVQNGLLAWFPFNGDVKDYSGNENNLSGTLTYSEDKKGVGNGCAYFNGNKSLSFSKSWSLKNAFTIACWAKPALSPGFDSQYLCKSLCNDGSTFRGWPCIFFPAAVSGTKNGSMGLSIGGDRVVNHIMMAGSFNAPTYKDCSILNQWHHIALSVNGNTSIVLYIDGKKVDSSTGFWCVGLAYNNFNADLLLTSAGKIGGGSTGVNAAMFYKGYIDDFCVYNRGLTAAEIAQLFGAK